MGGWGKKYTLNRLLYKSGNNKQMCEDIRTAERGGKQRKRWVYRTPRQRFIKKWENENTKKKRGESLVTTNF